MKTVFSIIEAAELVDIKPTLLKLWVETEKFTPSIRGKGIAQDSLVSSPLEDTIYFFNKEDIRRLTEFAEQQGKQKPRKSNGQFIDDGKHENFTVSEIASLWKLSTDTIQRMFEDEPGVVVLGNKNPRGKRKRLTLRIPRAVMERVKKLRSNSR